MGKSKWKGFYFDDKSAKVLQKLKSYYTNIQVSRNSTILPNFLTKTFEVYNGKKFDTIRVTIEMIGHKFGEFSFT